MTHTPFQSPKKQKQNKFLKYKNHNVHCTYVRMYISDLKKNYLKCSNNILNSALYTTALLAAPTEGQTGESDLRLHHIPEDFEFLDHKYDDTPIELFMRQGLSR